MNILYFILQQVMLFSIPLLVVALGGMFAERSGVVNMALEGIMIIGGFAGILFIHKTQNFLPSQTLLFFAILISILSGALISLTHAFASINLRAEQTISGTAINMFAPAFAIYTARLILGTQQIPFSNTFRIEKVPFLGDIPFLGPVFFQKFYITTLLGIIILVLSYIVLYKTKYGLRLRACGESPQAADTLGINVSSIRYSGVLISGA